MITANGDRLRLESFSGENGVHARLDLLPEGIDTADVGHGTTNVDVNAALRLALASLPRNELLHLDVGGEGLHVATLEATHVERPVDLPERWVRGLAEVGGVAHAMTPLIRLDAATALAFLGTIPAGIPGPTLALGAAGGRLRPMPASRAQVVVAGTSRLSSLTRLGRHLHALEVFTHPAGYSGWVAHLPGARLTLLLTPEVYRGFSGEGQLLESLQQAGAAEVTATPVQRVLEHLAWEARIEAAALVTATGLSAAQVEGALAILASSGRIGFDLVDQHWFHRELPLDISAIERRHPRLVKAQRLVAEGAVRVDPTSQHPRWAVTSSGQDRWVTLDPQECTCEWWARYRGGRGPCAHVVAVQLSTN